MATTMEMASATGMGMTVLAAMAAVGVHLVLGALWGDHGGTGESARRFRLCTLGTGALGSLGLSNLAVRPVAGASVATSLAAAALGWWLTGIPLAALGMAAAGSSAPTLVLRRRRSAERREIRDCWPRIIEEIRVLTGSVGRPVPQALLEAGLRGPEGSRGAFVAAQREWALTTDFGRTVSVLKHQLGDPFADAVCETLLTVHDVGGDLDLRLSHLADDQRRAVRERRDAEARMSGARVARWFVLLVPSGMFLAGLGLGDGATAYRSAAGQAAVVAAAVLVTLCWWWAGRIMTVPAERRVFDR